MSICPSITLNITFRILSYFLSNILETINCADNIVVVNIASANHPAGSLIQSKLLAPSSQQSPSEEIQIELTNNVLAKLRFNAV